MASKASLASTCRPLIWLYHVAPVFGVATGLPFMLEAKSEYSSMLSTVVPNTPAEHPATGVLVPVQMPKTLRASSGQLPPKPPSPPLQIFERSMATPPRAGVLPPRLLKAPTWLPPSAGSLKYTSSAVASICARNMELQVLPVLEQVAPLMMLETYVASFAQVVAVSSLKG